MEEMEAPTEHLHEQIQDAAREEKDRWSMLVAISTGFMAAFAAVSSLMAGHHSNEAMIAQIKASDQWAFYQAKGIKSEISKSVLALNSNNQSEPALAAQKNIDRYKQEQDGIKDNATELEKESEVHIHKDMVLARCVTLFQIAIAMSAISILSKRRLLWYFGLALSAIGVVEFIVAITF